MVELYQFPAAFGLPNVSSFCLKLETYLRMAEIPFTSVYGIDMARAPKGKMPYIKDRDLVLGDSNFIIEHLKKTYGDRLDLKLTVTEQAISLALRRLIEENLYWVVIRDRWLEPENWELVKSAFFSELPPIVKSIVPNIARKNIQKQLHGHGMGKHSPDEIHAIGLADLGALSDFLGDKQFFFGGEPTSLDASAYGMLANILWSPFQSPLQDRARNLDNIVAFCTHIRDRYYGTHESSIAMPH
jgi:glutathione S-transferase